MPNHAKLLLNKVINEGDVKALIRYGVDTSHMPTRVDVDTLNFIENYAKENGGRSPSYATVSDNVVGFEYMPEITDSYEYLSKRVKAFAAKKAIVDLFDSGEFERNLNEMDGHTFVEEWLPSVLDSVKMRTSVRTNVGTDIKTGADKMLEEYERRKAGESFNIWKSRYSAIGEYISGNMYTVFGESGRGKSIFTLEDAIYAAEQGAKVLIWAMEMGWYELMVRIYTSISGGLGVSNAFINGVDMSVGFNARDIRTGNLNAEFEEAFKAFLRNINDHITGNITVRGVDDEDFTDRSLRALEADIERTNADFVVIDPFYYLHYEKNTSRTTGGDAANTSMRLRALTGRLDVVTIAITQSAVKKTETNDDGVRELRLPDRDGVRKTTNLLDDAAVLIGIDSDYQQGLGVVGVLKGRDGGEGDISNVLYLPQYGVVKEIEMTEDDASMFKF